MSGQHPLYNGKNATPLVKLDAGKNARTYLIAADNQATLAQSEGNASAFELRYEGGQTAVDADHIVEGKRAIVNCYEDMYARVDSSLRERGVMVIQQ